jgi:hypothetical protein
MVAAKHRTANRYVSHIDFSPDDDQWNHTLVAPKQSSKKATVQNKMECQVEKKKL